MGEPFGLSTSFGLDPERIAPPFSCKGRLCPSCVGRGMADAVAYLVDQPLPEGAYRQWVLTLPWALRYRMAYDAGLTSDLVRVFTRAVFASLRRRAKHRGDRRRLRCGAVTFIQRFGDALNLNVHFHTLALDGLYDDGDEGEMRFRPLPPLRLSAIPRLRPNYSLNSIGASYRVMLA